MVQNLVNSVHSEKKITFVLCVELNVSQHARKVQYNFVLFSRTRTL